MKENVRKQERVINWMCERVFFLISRQCRLPPKGAGPGHKAHRFFEKGLKPVYVFVGSCVSILSLSRLIFQFFVYSLVFAFPLVSLFLFFIAYTLYHYAGDRRTESVLRRYQLLIFFFFFSSFFVQQAHERITTRDWMSRGERSGRRAINICLTLILVFISILD
jgi:hypothetical protein